MHNPDDPGTLFREALNGQAPPAAELDLDRIVSDGYRARRRHRALLSGTATAGVAAVAAVLALSLSGAPAPDREQAADPTPDTAATAAPPEVEDPALAGYPQLESWEYQFDRPEQREVFAAVEDAFAPLLTEAGILDGALQDEFLFMPLQRPGNYGQTWLRSYQGNFYDEVGDLLRPTFTIEAMLPGGWTAEPGPVTEQLFPQHLIDDGAYYTDAAPEFETIDLDDGRTLFVADHGCAYDLAVLYPNGSGLRVSWDVDCSGETYPVDLEDLKAAVTAMPEFDFDTTGLAPVGELMDIPPGWVYDPHDAWVHEPDVRARAADTYAAAGEALDAVLPGTTLSGGAPGTLGLMDRGAVSIRSYSGSGYLPFETTVDEEPSDVHYSLRYYLPGGWVPGTSDIDSRGPELHVCKEEFECNLWGDDNGTQWGFEERVVTHEPGPGENWEPFTEHEFYATLYSPEGWAVGIWTTWQGDLPIDADLLADLLRALPAPEYDPDAVPEVPGS